MGPIRLGTLQVDPSRNIIANDGASWSIEPRIMDLLVLLVAHPGEVLSREFLTDTVWKVEFGADESLTRAVSLLRKTFREAGHSGEVIETIPKRGYRLVVTPSTDTPGQATGVPPARQVPADATGRPEAEPAPPVPPANLEPESAPARPETAWYRRPVIVGGAGLVALVVIAIAGFTMMRSPVAPSGQPVSQRIAFFGFTPASADPLAAEIAAAATDETIQALLALRLEAASRAETQGVALAQQPARAAELGAAYALGGEVRPASGAVSIHMHLEDVASRTTLWEQTVGGGTADKVSLPILAAGAATRVARCLTAARPGLPRQDGDLLAQLATACATPFIAYRDALPRWRALERESPNSAVVQANLANSLIYHANHADLSAAELREVWKEAAAAAQRALAIEPDNGVARTVLAYSAIFEGRPLAEAGKLMDEAVTDSPDDWRRGETGSNRNEFLQGVGLMSESLVSARAVIDRDPLSPTPYALLAHALVRVGREQEAGRVWEQMNTRWPDAWWDTWAIYAVQDKISDIELVLASAPARVSADSKTCWRQLAEAFASSDPAVRRAGADTAQRCGADGRIAGSTANLLRPALLGDVGGRLARYGELLDPSLPSNFLWNAGLLLSKNEHAFRADRQFLPLMKKSGIYQYWLDTGTHPDICDLPEEKAFEVCASLRADQAKKQ
jgi:DNA-binding winged helix-turn-helix (wHTH) protein/TolB-like protein